MKRTKKPLAVLMSIVLLLCAIPLMQASADSEYYESGPWEYTVEDGEATITYFYTEEDLFGKVSIPSTLGGYPVTGIEWISCYGSEIDLYIPACITKLTDPEYGEFGDGIVSINVDESHPAFLSVDGVLFNKDKTVLLAYPRSNTKTAYTIPDSVTSISDGAFCGSNNLASITIPNSVTTIGESAFAGCYKLTSITIPDSVTTIGESAFADCYKLTSITIPDSVTSIGDYAFSDCSSLTSITLPQSLQSIGKRAFAWCYDLESITIPDSVTSISDYAFSSCDSLTSVTLPQSLQSVGKYAFAWCNSLTEITVPAGVTSIGTAAFQSCDKLTAITVDKNNAYYSNDQYGVLFNKDKTQLLQCPASIEQYSVPDSVTSIGDCAFYSCDSLTSVTLPKSLQSIGESAFAWCDELESITIPDSVTSIGDYAFYSCDSLTSIKLSNNITEISGSMFADCNSLTNVSLPEGIASIGAAAFESCDKLEKITLPDSIKTIEPYAFGWTGIEEIYIPAGIEAIDYNAFNYSLEDIYFEGSRAQWNNTVTAMFPDDYYYDYEDLFLDSVNIHFNYSLEPASGSCGANATWDYNGMGTLTISGTGAMASYPQGQGAPWNEFADNIQVVEIEEGITKIDGFHELGYLETIILPESLKYIEPSAFSWGYYGEIKEVIYKGMPEQWENIEIGICETDACYDLCQCYDFDQQIIHIDNEDFKIDSLEILVGGDKFWNGSTTVKYGETVRLSTDIPTTCNDYFIFYNPFLPVGTQLNWYGNNGSCFDWFSYSDENYSLELTSIANGTETITVCLEDEDGYTIYNDDGDPIEASIELTSKAGIFEIIAYMFRSFFDMLISLFRF